MRRLSVVGIVILFITYSCTQNMGQEHKYTNKLINESSPYLLQHAHNPVDWYPWGDEALTKAQTENKLMIVSVGYAACHWCHVMEHESFEDSVVADKMNSRYVSIKVDREERPDIDQIYMDAAQLMTGRGGWPLNVITLPDGRPVFAGTYFPRENWIKVVDYFAELYAKDPDKLIEQAVKVTAGINQLEVPQFNESGSTFDESTFATINKNLLGTIDMQNGGRKGAPKFPMPSIYEFLMTQDYFMKDVETQKALKLTLDKMADGGIYDHLGGGFARYSTDQTWMVPHFEKMLYDNSQLVSLYSHAYQFYGEEKYKQAVVETLEFIDRELTDPSGGFYSSLDADSEGEEGKFYVWTQEEIKAVLEDDAAIFQSYYGISNEGNFEGNNILTRPQAIEKIAEKLSMSPEKAIDIITRCKEKLMKVRAGRVRPGLDDKILTSWNALMISGLVDAYFAIQDKDYLDRALKAGNFIVDNQIEKSGNILRNHKNGKPSINGFLDDYAFTALAFIKLYEATFDEKWLHQANKIKSHVNAHFSDEPTKMYFYTSDMDKKLIARKMELSDNVIPASNSAMAEVLYLLGQYFYNQQDLDRAKQMVANTEKDFVQSPYFYSNWARLYGLIGQKHFEMAIVGKDAQSKKLAIAERYIPNKILLGGKDEGSLELLEGKYAKGKTLIYVCENKACLLPVTDVAQAMGQLDNQGY